MAKSRSTRSNLYQLLNEAHRPVYVLDGKGHIVFANSALCGWLGTTAEQLESLQCIWTTDRLSDENLNRVRGLAAPPETFETVETESRSGPNSSSPNPSFKTKVFRTAADGHLIWRNAEFITLDGRVDSPGAVLVCVSATDLPANLPAAESSTDELINRLRTAQTQKFGYDHFVGVSPEAKLLSQKIRVTIGSDCNFIVVGEAGSQREQLARAIHAGRQESSGSSLPSELFPIHGAVADADLVQTTVLQVRERAGEGGWLLLLDVDRLSERATQELVGFFQLDSSKGQSNLRAIATCVDARKLPPELSECLCVLELEVTPLRNRKSDLPLLAQMILTETAGNTKIRFDESALQQIVDYNWPGNLEELKATIEEIDLTANPNKVASTSLPQRFVQALQAQQIGGPQIVEIQLDEYLANIESQLIERAMAFSGNNKAKACKLLGISRAKLGRRIQQLETHLESKSGPTEEPIVFEETAGDE